MGFIADSLQLKDYHKTKGSKKFYSFFSVPPGRPLIHNERGILVETTLGPYNEGSKLRLTCSVSRGKILFIPFMLKYYYTKLSNYLAIYLYQSN